MTRTIWLALTLTLSACGGGEQPASTPAPVADPAPKAVKIEGPARALLVVQAWFKREGKKPVPQPAKLVIWRTDGNAWSSETLLDPDSNVFHKAMPWRDGILTIGAEQAKLKHWKKVGDSWKATTLWEKSWGGKFDRLRDVEIGDVTNDGKDNIVIATHDQGVVAVGTEQPDGSWSFLEMDQKPDTFVHEIEIGDIDGDGKNEFYCTPSDRNRASGVSQPGGVVRYDYRPKKGTFERREIVHWEASHAKEILVTDMDDDGVDELYVVREAHTEKGPGGRPRIVEPVKISRVVPDDLKSKGKGKGKGTSHATGFSEEVIFELQDRQCRFLVPGDVDGDGKKDLVAAGMQSGLWLLRADATGKYHGTVIEARSGGFEHATHVADLDGDGQVEVYVADDKNTQKLLRFVWNDGAFDKTVIGDLGKSHITWNIQDAFL